MKTLLAVLALVLCASCAEKAEPLKTYYRVRGRAGTQVYEAPCHCYAGEEWKLLDKLRSVGADAWMEVSTDSGRTWGQATDNGAQTTFTVEEKP